MRTAKLLPLLAILSACGSSAQRLPAIKQARSLAAEWALVNEQALLGRVTARYTTEMRTNLRAQIGKVGGTIKCAQCPERAIVAALMQLPATASPDAIRDQVRQLKQIEKPLESA